MQQFGAPPSVECLAPLFISIIIGLQLTLKYSTTINQWAPDIGKSIDFAKIIHWYGKHLL